MSNNIVNISLQKPLCLYYHPKIITAAIIQMAIIIREMNGFQPGFLYKSLIAGHPWYKLIDSEIDIQDMQSIIDILWPLATTESLNRQIPVPQLRNILPEPPASSSSSAVVALPEKQEVVQKAVVPEENIPQAKEDPSSLVNGH